MHRHPGQGKDWAIVLAGGSGLRLSALARDIAGRAVPKQYCSLHGGASLLNDALARATAVVPPGRVVVVVAAEHERFWRRELCTLPPANVIVQPQNRGTAAGILLPLLAILARDPDARVAVLPSDHHVAREPVLREALGTALGSLRAHSTRMVLLGIQPDEPDHEYGWIVPGQANGTTRAVARFVEKPDAGTAAALAQRGAVWNSFIGAAAGRTLLGLLGWRLPALVAAFARLRDLNDRADLGALYERIQSADFSREVLQGSEAALCLQIVPSCGWTDLGTPRRVQQCLSLRAPRRGHRSEAAADLASLVARELVPTRPTGDRAPPATREVAATPDTVPFGV